jgi:hypothetical protein
MTSDEKIEQIEPIIRLIIGLSSYYRDYTRDEIASEFARLTNCSPEMARMWVDFTLDQMLQK